MQVAYKLSMKISIKYAGMMQVSNEYRALATMHRYKHYNNNIMYIVQLLVTYQHWKLLSLLY